MKKIIAGIMSLVLMGSILTGCGVENAKENSASEESALTVAEENTESASADEPEETEAEETADEISFDDLLSGSGSSEDAGSMMENTANWISADKVTKEAVSAADFGDTSGFSMADYYDSQAIDCSMEMMALFMPVTTDVKKAKDSSASYFNISMKMDFSALAGMMGSNEDVPDSVTVNYIAKVDSSTGETIIALPDVKKFAKMSADEAGLDLDSYENMVPEITAPETVAEVEHNGQKMYRVSYVLPAAEIAGFSAGSDSSVCGLKMTNDNNESVMYVWFDESYNVKALCSAPMGMPQFIEVKSIGSSVDVASVYNTDGFEEVSAEEMAEALAAAQTGM